MALTPEQIAKIRGAAFNQNRVTSTSPITGETTQPLSVRAPTVAVNQPGSSAPPTAVDAPTKGNNNIFTGLCEALNQHQQDLVTKGTYEVADEYAIEFAPAAIGASRVVKPGPVTYKNTAGKNTNTAADKLDSSTDQVNVNSQKWDVLAGTQIVQFIDQVMRSSSYITNQQKVNFNEDGEQIKNSSAGANGITAWYKISVSAKQLKYDNQRRDHAYRMTFTISPYSINQMASPYFPKSVYRGAHKEYNYWFTGLNTQIISYEQQYNQAYYTTITANATGLANPPPSGRDQFKQTYMATSEQRGQGQANYVNEPADNAAAFLYSVTDFSEVQLKIVGDPSWMQQGEAAQGVNASTFNFNPFNPDGTINYDSQEVTFKVNFNRPTDYNFNTGIMNTNSATGAPQETFTFIAKSCKNVFSKGQFTQELVGSLLTETNTTQSTSSTANGRSALPAPGSSRNSDQFDQLNSGIQRFDDGSFMQTFDDGSILATDVEGNVTSIPSPQPAAEPTPATSNGDILTDPIDAPPTADQTELGTPITTTNPPQYIARDD